jgi:hypothetical protein
LGSEGRGRKAQAVDRITLAIELIGAVILLLWTVIPVREFSSILKTIRQRNLTTTTATTTRASSE